MAPWLFQSWRANIHSPSVEIALAFIAVFCGAIVGSEREKREKPAGLRTLILVCLGSAGFTMASFLFGGAPGDSARIAAQIVSGVGFLGAGVIMHGRSSVVSGATTAATIWAVAAIGMIAGAGYAGGAIGLSFLVRLVLSAMRLIETHVTGERNEVDVEIAYIPNGGITKVRLQRVLAGYSFAPIGAECSSWSAEQDKLTLRLHLRRLHLRELLAELADVPDVKSIRETAVVRGRLSAAPLS